MSSHHEADPFADLDTDPRSRAIVDDYRAREGLIDDLVERRKLLGVSQAEVASRMGVGQSTISEFENEATDPRLSTLQRYARAVGAEVSVSLQTAADQALHQWRLAASALVGGANLTVVHAGRGVSVPRQQPARRYVEATLTQEVGRLEGVGA